MGEPRVDLHTHSLASDGALAPADLLALAALNGVEMLALTDHDTMDGYAELERAVADACPASAAAGNPVASVRLIHGVELSTTWSGVGIHVLGLNVDRHERTLAAGLREQSHARSLRAERITEILARAGVPVSLDGVRALAGGVPGRPHFARYLVDQGLVSDRASAFKKFLGAGKPGDVKTGWAALDDIVRWIRSAGGIAVLAHPAKYKLSRTRLRRLIDTFKEAGGGAIEVVSGRQEGDVTASLAKLATTTGLLASCGSDFHQPGHAWATVGMDLPLPRSCEPIWHAW